MNEKIPLFEKYPNLMQIPRITLVQGPTPVQRMKEAEKELNAGQIWVKRDDLCNPKYGGNKPRKYEFVLADALQKKKKCIVTIGGIGSNHTLANSLYAKDIGLESEIYLFDQPLTSHVRQNLLCDFLFGAKMHYTKSYVKTGLAVIWKLLTDRRSYLVMPGASIPVGTIGFVNAALELAEQIKNGELPEPDILFVAVGSTGTCAGLTLGLELARLKTKVIGIGVSMKIVTSRDQVLSLAKKTWKYLQRFDKNLPDVRNKLSARLEVTHNFFGGEYGRATFEGIEAIKLAQRDGIKLDVTYTGKTFSGLMSYCREDSYAKNQVILFWNTLNSVDLTNQFCNIDYHKLPPNFHQFFDETKPLDDTPVYAKNNK
jgi:D-cysteine desulfhydrase